MDIRRKQHENIQNNFNGWKKESLTDLARALKAEFPKAVERFDRFELIEGVRPFFGAADPVIKEINIYWTTENPTKEEIDEIERVIAYIKASGIGGLDADITEH